MTLFQDEICVIVVFQFMLLFIFFVKNNYNALFWTFFFYFVFQHLKSFTWKKNIRVQFFLWKHSYLVWQVCYLFSIYCIFLFDLLVICNLIWHIKSKKVCPFFLFSELHYRPKRRFMTKKEMKQLTKKFVFCYFFVSWLQFFLHVNWPLITKIFKKRYVPTIFVKVYLFYK